MIANPKRKLPWRTALIGALCGFASAAFAAPLANGDFESGSLAGWSFGGSNAGHFGQAVAPALDGAHSALLVAPGDGACTFDTWSAGCGGSGTAPPIGYASAARTAAAPNQAPIGFPARQWAAIAQEFDAHAGDHVRFSMQLLGEAALGGILDGAMVSLLAGPGGSPTQGATWCTSDLGSTSTIPPCPMAVGWGDPAFQWFGDFMPAAGGAGVAAPSLGFKSGGTVLNWDVLVPTDGPWTLTVAVFQAGDSEFASGVLVDDFRVVTHGVPEPGTLVLLGSALLLGAATRRKRPDDDAEAPN